MSYNLGISSATLLVSLITIFFMYRRQSSLDKLLGPFILSYSVIQFAEALMFYDKNCGQINIIGGNIVFFSLISHVLGLGFGMYLMNKDYRGIIVGLFVIIYYTIVYKIPKIECSKKDKYMKWGFDSTFYKYIYIYIFILILFIDISNIYKIVLLLLYTVPYLYFFHDLYGIQNLVKIDNPNDAGSRWCNAITLASPLLYLMQTFIK